MAPHRSGSVNAELVKDVLRELMPEIAKIVEASLGPVVEKLTQLIETMAAREQRPPTPAPIHVEADGEAEKCRRSVVVIGLPEADGEPQERNAVDAASVRSIFNELNVDSKPLNVYRMGGFNGERKRPVKVEFTNMHDAVQVLRKSFKLKSSNNYAAVFIRKSHTHALRVELMNKRKSDPDNMYVIYNDKVVVRRAFTPKPQPGDLEAGGSVRRSDRPAAMTAEFAEYRASLQPVGALHSQPSTSAT